MCVCVCARARACVRVCVCVCVRARVFSANTVLATGASAFSFNAPGCRDSGQARGAQGRAGVRCAGPRAPLPTPDARG